MLRGTTTAKLVKANAVTAATTAAAALSVPAGDKPVQVAYGFPGEAQIAAELIFFGAIQADDDWSTIGNGARDENYTINLVVNVLRSGWSQQRVTERAFDLLTMCDKALTSGQGAQLLPAPGWSRVLFSRLTERPGDGAREAEIVAGLRVYARI